MRKKLTYFAISLLLLAITLGILANSRLAKQWAAGFAQRLVKNRTGMDLRIGSLDYTWSPLTVRLDDVQLNGAFFHADHIVLTLPYSSIFGGSFVIHQLEAGRATCNLDLLPHFPKTGKPSSAKFSIENAVLREGTILVSGRRISIPEAAARIGSDESILHSLTAELDGIRMTASGSLLPGTRIEYDVQGDAGKIYSLAAQPPWKLGGPVTAKGLVEGKNGKYRISGTANAPALTANGSAPFPVTLQYEVQQDHVRAYHVSAEWSSLPLVLAHTSLEGVNCSGKLTYAGPDDFWSGEGSAQTVLSGNTHGLPLSGNLQGRLSGKRILIEPGVLRAGSAQAELSGTLDAAYLFIKTRTTIPDPASMSAFYTELKNVPGSYTFDGTLSGPYKNPLLNGTLSGKNVKAAGSVLPLAGKLDLEFSGNVQASELHRILPEGLTGALRFSGSISGHLSRPLIRADALATGVVFRGADLGDVQIHAQSDTRILNAALTGTSIEATGSYTFASKAFEVNGEIRNGSLDLLHAAAPGIVPEHPGELSGRFHASGRADLWRAADAALEVQSATLQWQDRQLCLRPGAVLSLHQGLLEVDLQADHPMGSISVTGSADVFKTQNLDLHVSGRASASLLQEFAHGIRSAGTVSLDADIRGTAVRPYVNGILHAGDLEITAPAQLLSLKQGSVEAQFIGDHVTIALHGLLNNAALSGQGQVQLLEQQSNVEITLKSFPIESVIPGAGVTGNLDLTLNAGGRGWAPQHWNADAMLFSADLQLNETRLISEGPLLLELKQGRLHVGPWHGRADDRFDVSVNTFYDIRTGEMGGEVNAVADLGVIKRLPKGIETGGILRTSVRAGGTLSSPRLSGALSLQNGVLRVPDPPLYLENIELSAPITPDGLVIETLTARSGGGTLTAGGTLKLVDRKWQADVTLQGKNVGLQYPPGLRSRVNFDLKLASSLTRALLSGEVTLLQSSYNENVDLSNRLVRTLLSKREDLAPRILLQSRIQLDLKLRTAGDLQMRNNMGRIRAGADLRIGGNLYQPKLGGTINLRSGSVVYFLGQTFEVEKAQMRLVDSARFRPYFDVVLSTLVEDSGRNTLYEILLPFSGPWDDIRFVHPRAIPSLSEDEIYSLLLTGRADTETESYAASMIQRELAAFVSGQLLFGAESRIAGLLGLTRVQFRTDALTSEEDPQTKLVLTKDFAGGFSFLYSFPLDQPNDQTFIGSYRYRRNLIFRAIAQDDGTYTFSGRQTLYLGAGADPNLVHFAQENVRPDVIVSDLRIVNQSPLEENRIRKTIDLIPGSRYDYWEFQDNVDRLKQDLQKQGFLFPSVSVEEKEQKGGANQSTVDLAVTVAAGVPSRMVYTGEQPNSNQTARYLGMWRDGISESLVLDQIQNDILRELRLRGYQKAAVTVSTRNAGDVRVYEFRVDRGALFRSVLPEFHGAANLDSQRLLKALVALYGSQAEMSVDLLHDFPEFQKYMEAAYFKEGYLGTKVKEGSLYTDEKAGIITRVVEIQEGSVTRIDTISASVTLPPDLTARFKVHPGSPVNVEALAVDEATVNDYFERQGYRSVSVAPSVARASGSDLTLHYEIELGSLVRVASIRIEGNHVTSDELIRKQVGFKEGDVLSRPAVVRAQNRLYSLGVFQNVGVRAEANSDPDLQDVVVELTENKRYQFQYGLRYNTESDLGGELGFANLNMFGLGHTATLYGRYDAENPLYRFDYLIPPFAGLLKRSFITAFYEEDDTTLSDYLDNRLTDDTLSDVPVGTRDVKVEFQQEKRLLKTLRIYYGVSYEDSTLKILELERNLRSKATLLQSSLFFDTRDDALNATKGNFVSINAKWSPGLLSESVAFSRIYTQYYTYKRLGPVVWASAVRAGFMDAGLNTFTLDEKFLAGGGSSLRGFRLNSIAPQTNEFTRLFGGNSVFILNEELRFPIHGKLFAGALFYDGGNVYALASDFDPTDLRNSAGFGLRLDFTALVLRFDLGFNLKPLPGEPHAVFHFGIGQAF